MKQKRITVVIQTYNEEDNISSCIESARLLTDDVVVIDTESIDSTVSRAKGVGVAVHQFPYNGIVEPARNFGIEKANGEWVFLLDADERMTKECAKQINYVIEEGGFTHYRVRRRNIFLGKKWLKWGGWWPDSVIRLIKKSAFITWPKEIHSSPRMRGNEGEVDVPFDHHFHSSLSEMVQKTCYYEERRAKLFLEGGEPVSVCIFIRKFLGEIYRRMIMKAGFLDGMYGLIEAMYQAYSTTITYIFLYEKKQKETSNC